MIPTACAVRVAHTFEMVRKTHFCPLVLVGTRVSPTRFCLPVDSDMSSMEHSKNGFIHESYSIRKSFVDGTTPKGGLFLFVFVSFSVSCLFQHPQSSKRSERGSDGIISIDVLCLYPYCYLCCIASIRIPVEVYLIDNLA